MISSGNPLLVILRRCFKTLQLFFKYKGTRRVERRFTLSNRRGLSIVAWPRLVQLILLFIGGATLLSRLTSWRESTSLGHGSTRQSTLKLARVELGSATAFPAISMQMPDDLPCRTQESNILVFMTTAASSI